MADFTAAGVAGLAGQRELVKATSAAQRGGANLQSIDISHEIDVIATENLFISQRFSNSSVAGFGQVNSDLLPPPVLHPRVPGPGINFHLNDL